MAERLRIGTVVARSLSIWGRDLPRLFALALVAGTPPIVAWYLVPEAPETRNSTLAWWLAYLPRGFLETLSWCLALAAIAFAVRERGRGKRLPLLACLQGTVRRAWPLLGLTLFYVALFVALGLCLPWFVHSTWPYTITIDVRAFVAALLIPEALALCPFVVAVPVTALERSGPGVWRSWVLTRGFRLRIVVALLLLLGLDFVLGWRMSLALRGLPRFVRIGASLLLMFLEASLVGVFAAVGYEALREEKEGGDPGAIAETFA